MCSGKEYRIYKHVDVINDKDIIRKIEAEFISSDHRIAIEDASIDGKFIASFRAAGTHTLERLKDGSAAKGHDILEKSIKESSISAYYKENYTEIFNRLNNRQLLGFVGHWDVGGLKGIYITISIDGYTIKNKGKDVYPIDVSSDYKLDKSIAHLKSIPSWRSYVYTGDYDLHDLITLRSGRPRTVLVSGGKYEYGVRVEEDNIINLINDKVNAIDKARKNRHTHYVIQHGPQVNYVSYMKEYEPHLPLVESVANPGEFPVALVNKGVWTIVEDLKGLNEYYSVVCTVMKHSWADRILP